MKYSLKKLLWITLATACFAALFFGCTSRRERARETLAKMEIVEVDHLGYVRYDGEVMKPGDFARRLAARRKVVEGKPVLLSVNPEVYTRQPEIVPYLRRQLEHAKTGKIYDKIPNEL